MQPRDADGHLQNIARALWAPQSRGGTRAAVFVGAGFSRNATRKTESSRSFPLWTDLARALVDDLLPPCGACNCLQAGAGGVACNFANRRRALFASAQGTSGAMRLAQMHEEEYGRAPLRALLERAIPDDDHEPGDAHKHLVGLPWVDIFTTNWDTLLERAVESYNRSYLPVRYPGQLATVSSPRIVKLHGTVGMGGDLVFSEEDFRRYPRTHAPFVSVVQQSFMENVFVLIGFSGEDPNFLAWHGWVRDTMGDYLQHVYLVLLSPIEKAERALLTARRIIPLELPTMYPGRSPGSQIIAFLEELRDMRRVVRPDVEWPAGNRSRATDSGSGAPTFESFSEMMQYRPAWLVTPRRAREAVISKIGLAVTFNAPSNRITELFGKKIAGLADVQDRDVARSIELLAEAIEVSLSRPGRALQALMEALVQRTLIDEVGPHLPPGLMASISKILGAASGSGPSTIDWDDLLSVLKSHRSLLSPVLRFPFTVRCLERECRFAGEGAQAKLYRCLLSCCSEQSEHLSAYADVLSEISASRPHAALAKLFRWRPATDEPIWSLRRASLLHEFGLIDEALDEAEIGVDFLRKMATQRDRDPWKITREAWSLEIYRLLITSPIPKRSRKHRQSGALPPRMIAAELHERLVELLGHASDPAGEIEALSWALAAENLIIDDTTPLLPWSSDALMAEQAVVRTDAGSAMIRLAEEVGLPISCFGHDLLRSAFVVDAGGDARLAASLVLRVGTDDAFRERDPSRKGSGQPPAGWEKIHQLFAASGLDPKSLLAILKGLLLPEVATEDARAVAGMAPEPYIVDRVEFLLGYFLNLAKAEGSSLEEAQIALEAAKFLYESSEMEKLDELGESVFWTFLESMKRLAHPRPGEDNQALVEQLVAMLCDLRSPVGPSDVRSSPSWPDPFRWFFDDQDALNELGGNLAAQLAGTRTSAAARDLMVKHLRVLEAALTVPGRTGIDALRRRQKFLLAVLAAPAAPA